MLRSDHRILTTHTGSLPRPPSLTRLYVARIRGEAVTDAEILAAGRAAVADIVPRQVAAGIDIGNDGEQTREAFFLYLSRRLSGFGGAWDRPPRADVEQYPAFKKMMAAANAAKVAVSGRDSVPKAVGEIRYVDASAIEEECATFGAILDANGRPFREAFMTAPSPGILARSLLNEYYATEADYLDALGRALRVEYEAIVRHGYLLQIDAPDLALERHISFAGQPLSAFLDFVEAVVDTINRVIEGIPRDRVRLHVCWGNYEGPHDRDVPLKDILPAVAKARVGGFVLPFANPRHAHEYRCLEGALADDQVVVAGVLDTLTNVIEHPEVIAERLQRVAEVLGHPGRVLAGTDCGFDTGAGAGRVAEDVVWAKLTSLRDGARLATERLFR
ncbi:cobalamin-independent methionine synthase II family protein [Falsiroseomonas sp. HW251]|uniref:cobalamin-independent methionine synthase II family protein n=1 Tax=Falsiroseomonas sp. HW251 TaxID=3390998 RepID=UPI003D31AFE2